MPAESRRIADLLYKQEIPPPAYLQSTNRNCELIAFAIYKLKATKDSPVYICICNALTDRKLKEAIATSGSRCPEDVYAACGCRAKCGKCVQLVKELLKNHAPLIEGSLQSAG